jgi:hypothetical protein
MEAALPRDVTERSQLPKVARSADNPISDDIEDLRAVLRGVGSVMFLTSTRIIVARDGHERRPRSGIQSFALGRVAAVRLEPGSGSSGRIVVLSDDGVEATSVFFDSRSRDRAEVLVALSNAAIADARPGSSPPTRRFRRRA